MNSPSNDRPNAAANLRGEVPSDLGPGTQPYPRPDLPQAPYPPEPGGPSGRRGRRGGLGRPPFASVGRGPWAGTDRDRRGPWVAPWSEAFGPEAFGSGPSGPWASGAEGPGADMPDPEGPSHGGPGPGPGP